MSALEDWNAQRLPRYGDGIGGEQFGRRMLDLARGVVSS